MNMVAQMKDETSFASLAPDTVIVVYDEKTGLVRHVHQELTLRGGMASTREALTVRANAFAHELSGRLSKKLKAMYIAPSTFGELRGALAVDLKTGVLIKRKAASDPERSKNHSKKKSSAGSQKLKQKRRRR
jgi:hypothetical protein